MAPDETHHSLILKSECSTDKCLIHCSGELVANGCVYLLKTVTELLPATRLIVLDLSDLEWIDSMGLGTLVRIYNASKSAGCQLQLVNVGKRINELLILTNLVGIFA